VRGAARQLGGVRVPKEGRLAASQQEKYPILPTQETYTLKSRGRAQKILHNGSRCV
jgi:hypothetical protein